MKEKIKESVCYRLLILIFQVFQDLEEVMSEANARLFIYELDHRADCFWYSGRTIKPYDIGASIIKYCIMPKQRQQRLSNHQ